ncbi:MAG TPA: host attachment protein [Azospirillum sp.]|nr:host attachment protein [Azospirillum sp.]
MLKHARVWFVLADGARARILDYRMGREGRFEEITREESEDVQRRARQRANDLSGRNFMNSPDTRHTAGSRNDPHAQAKIRFEHQIAHLVNQAAARNAFDALVIVAPPHTIGTLRQALCAAAKERLLRQATGDLLGMPDPPLFDRLSAMLRPG